MKVAMDCTMAQDQLRDYVENTLPEDLRGPVARHLSSCPSCREAYERRKNLVGLMANTLGQMKINQNFEENASQRLSDIDQQLDQLRTPGMGNATQPEEVSVDQVPLPWSGEAGGEAQEDGQADGAGEDSQEEEEAALSAPESGAFSWLSSAPWWGVSVALHVLIIIFLGLITMSIGTPAEKDGTIVVTSLERPNLQKLEDPQKKTDLQRDVFNAKHETPPTDPNSTVTSNVLVPPDILAQAELSDHFETINPDRPDTHSAFGNPEAQMFHSVSGNDEPAGGGGMGGQSLLDDLIGVGGAASPGTGGGWGGGNGTGIGVGNGSGSGSFGQRNGGGRRLLVMRHGGGKATESAVDKGLEWLARNQEADGKWDNAKHGGKHAGIAGDAAMTGFALLAFLGAGHTEKVGRYKDNVRNAVKWLIENQGKGNGRGAHEGRWSPGNYTQGIATMGLGEAAAMGRIPETKKAAQLAADGVDFGQIKKGESDREAWDYAPGGTTNDSSVMAWNIMALKSCKVGGMKVEPACFEGCLNWINAGQDLGNLKPTDPAPETDWEGGRMSYRGTCAEPKKGQGGMAVMAAAALCRLHIGGAKPDDAGVAGPCNIILKKQLPRAYPYNLYFGYYAALLMFQKGGEHWKAWNEAMKKALVDGQVKGGNDDGSWSPTGAGSDDSRVMSTALATLSLEVYYRYLPLFKE